MRTGPIFHANARLFARIVQAHAAAWLRWRVKTVAICAQCVRVLQVICCRRVHLRPQEQGRSLHDSPSLSHFSATACRVKFCQQLATLAAFKRPIRSDLLVEKEFFMHAILATANPKRAGKILNSLQQRILGRGNF